MLLQQIDNSGYPVEYLSARIGVRKSFLISDWQSVASAADPLAAVGPDGFLAGVQEQSTTGVWRAMLREYRWVRSQLDHAANRHFMVFFVWLELKTIMLCLRNLQARREREISLILEASMLSSHVRELFESGDDPADVMEKLEPTLALLSIRFCGAADVFTENGSADLERWLEEAWLEWVAELSLSSGIAGFYAAMVDFRNLMRLYKTVRWEVENPPRFLPGGTIARAAFSEALTGGDREQTGSLVRRFVGRPDMDLSKSPENALFEGITRQLRRVARGWAEYGRIVEYLWLIYVETRNMGILLTAADPAERHDLVTEMVP